MENTCSGSTIWEWRRVKIGRRPEGPANRPPGGSRLKKLTPWPRSQRLELRVVHLGGSESYYEIRTRGEVVRVPGHWCFDDVMGRIYND